jgi:hypothetical protein
MINKRKNAPPPLVPATYGNFQMAPNPIAAPADARIKPSRDDHLLLSSIKSPFLIKQTTVSMLLKVEASPQLKTYILFFKIF